MRTSGLANQTRVVTASQGELNFSQPAGRRREVFLREVKSGINPSSHFEGDLAVTFAVGGDPRLAFEQVPLNLCYIAIIRAFRDDVNQALKNDDAVEAATAVAGIRRSYFTFARQIHTKAAATVCSDASRYTTAVGFCNNCMLTLLRITQVVLDGNWREGGVIEIDLGLGGIRSWDGGGIDFGFDPKEHYSAVQRADPSRGKQYLSSQHATQKQDMREISMLALMRGDRSVLMSQGTPSAIYAPISDAFRGTVDSIRREIVRAADDFRHQVRRDFAELPDEDAEEAFASND